MRIEYKAWLLLESDFLAHWKMPFTAEEKRKRRAGQREKAEEEGTAKRPKKLL